VGTTPDELRTEVEARRSHLAHNVDLLTERVAPKNIARRRVDSARRRLTTVKEQVMGTVNETGHAARDLAGHAGDAGGQLTDRVGGAAGQLTDRVGDTAGQIAETVQRAPARARRQTQGNPLAAGIIAFGAGMLAATLTPVSDAEKRLGAQVRQHADDLLEPAKEAATEAVQHVTQELREPAQDAAQSVTSTARDAVQATQESGRQAAQDTAEELKQVGSDAAQQVRGRVSG
jgi:gas vesicle protein